MESKLFLEIFERERSSNKISKLSYFGLTWDQWTKFVNMTRGLDYGCNFNKEGKTCSGGDTKRPVKGSCCCGNCRSCVGYLKLVPDNSQAIGEIASLFDENRGFWRKKKGCILSTKYRSDVCIGYRCHEAKKHRNSGTEYLAGATRCFEQLALCLLDTFRARSLSETQTRTIIKELIKNDDERGGVL